MLRYRHHILANIDVRTYTNKIWKEKQQVGPLFEYVCQTGATGWAHLEGLHSTPPSNWCLLQHAAMQLRAKQRQALKPLPHPSTSTSRPSLHHLWQPSERWSGRATPLLYFIPYHYPSEVIQKSWLWEMLLVVQPVKPKAPQIIT